MKIDPTGAKFEWVYPNSFTQKYKYYCDKAYLRDLGKTTILILNTTACIIMLYLADLIGRKPILILGSLNIIAGMAINCFYPDLFIKLLGLGWSSGSEGVFSAMFTMLINEVTRNFPFNFITNILVKTTKLRSTLVSGCFFAFALGCIFINIVTLFIKDGQSLANFAFVLTSIVMLGSFFCYAESPKWLYNKGKFDGLIKSLVFISSRNGTNFKKRDFYNLLCESEEEYQMVKSKTIKIDIKKKKSEKKKNSFMQILTNKS